MNRQVRVQSDSPRSKNQFLLAEKENPTETTKELSKSTTRKKKKGQGQVENGSNSNRFGEIVGGTAAECAAVCCCCPCTLMNLLVLAIYKMPACICRKAKKRHRLMKMKKQKHGFLVGPQNTSMKRREELEKEVKAVVEKHKNHNASFNHNDDDDDDEDGETEGVDLEKQMWDQFYATGFWRSPSQRH